MADNKVLLTDVSEKFRSARELVKNVPYEIHDLTDYMAQVLNDQHQLAPEGLMMFLVCTLDDLKNERCGFGGKVEFPKALIEEKLQILMYLKHFPLVIDKIASDEFSKTFREQFTTVFGEAMPPVVETEDYGVTIVEEGVVDISNKDKAQVLMSLYNNSHPQGLGFLHFNPEPMTIEQAREILAKTQDFDYLAGRVMKISLESNLVRTWGYNRDNGEGAAEKAISQCPNI